MTRPPDPAALYVARLGTEHSRKTARSALRTLERAYGAAPLPWEALTYADIARIRAALSRLSVAWGSTCLSVLRQCLREGQRLGAVDADLVGRAFELPPLRGTCGRLGRNVTDSDITALLAAVDPTTLSGRRDGAVLGLLLGGLRCSETTTVDVDDYDPGTGRVTVRQAKGRKQRVVPLRHAARTLIDDWVAVHPGDGRMLRPIDRWMNVGDRLSARTVQVVLAGLCARAGIEHLSPHALRAHAITSVISLGDVYLAMRLAGHAKPDTTARYDRRGLDELASVIDRLDEPTPAPPLRLVQ
jgi:site-specific recombinase XerC